MDDVPENHLTISEYATAKKLPEDFLRDTRGIRDNADGIVIPYRNADGTLHKEFVEVANWRGFEYSALSRVLGLGWWMGQR